MTGRPRQAPFPTRDQVLEFIRESRGPVGKREIARAFHIRGADRKAMNAMLRELQEEGLLGHPRHRRFSSGEPLPPVTVIVITGTDDDGEVLAEPEGGVADGVAPRIYLSRRREHGPAPGVGDRALARLRRMEDGSYEAAIIRRLEAGPRSVLGVFAEREGGGRIIPTDRRVKNEVLVAAADTGDAVPGDLVRADLRPGHRFGLPHGRVTERLGSTNDPRSASLIAIHSHGIPDLFDHDALDQAARATAAPIDGRTDLRDVPLVTIDDADARDFDDAVWAEPDPSPDNAGGWHLRIAIADVAWYVRPGDALDRCAHERGNSVYCPDRVVPMLPEALSNDLCSLRPDAERPCMAVDIWIDRAGNKLRHRFARGVMRSAARLTYEQVQAAFDDAVDESTGPLLDSVIKPLHGAYAALKTAREARGTIDLDLPERRIRFDDDMAVRAIEPRPRYDSHRVIEEFMIAANVCAAETLERRRQPCMYRIHDQPAAEKLEALRELLGSLGYRLARGQVLQSRHFNQIVRRARGSPEAEIVNEAVLRSQSQAAYSADNIGHFGLALRRYAHFTSPIRRYSDLLVHRALISGLGLGEGGLAAGTETAFTELADHVSTTERRAVAAERDSLDRLTTGFMAGRIGDRFAARISGVTRFGLFVTLGESGARGLVPLSTMGDEFFRHDPRRQALTGAETGKIFGLGDTVKVTLVQADVMTGTLSFRLAEGGGRARTARPGKAGRGRRRRGR